MPTDLPEDQLFALIEADRRAVADQLETLDDTQWNTQSLCEHWTVRQVAAHLTMGWNVSTPKFMLAILKNRGDFNKASVGLVAKLAERLPADIIADLRANAGHRFTPPGAGAVAPLSDVVTHGLDMWVPLGLDPVTPIDTYRPVLDMVANPPAKRWIYPMTDSSGLRFETTDLDWSSGSGDVVSGSAVSMTLALSAREHGFEGLEGPGVSELRRRMEC